MYREKGYAPACITEYVMTLLNSNYEEWRAANPEKPFTEFPFSIKKMSASGALFDADKLYDICKNTVSRMTAAEVYDGLADWAREYDAQLYACLAADRGYAERILSIGRGGREAAQGHRRLERGAGLSRLFLRRAVRARLHGPLCL